MWTTARLFADTIVEIVGRFMYIMYNIYRPINHTHTHIYIVGIKQIIRESVNLGLDIKIVS